MATSKAPDDTMPIGYRAAHKRVIATRGMASGQACADCGQQASEWSYQHDDPDEMIAGDYAHAGMPYSANADHYAPRCRGCHTTFDKARRARSDGEPTYPTPGWEARQWAPEVTWDIRQGLRLMAGTPDQPIDDVLDLLATFVGAQDENDLATAALWAATTHLAARGVGNTTPRLVITAPTHGAGKSTLLGIIERVSHQGERIDSTITDALLPRILMDAQGMPTLCIDEADKTLRAESTNATAILNAGWSRDGMARVNIQAAGGDWKPEKIPIFAPIALAGNGVKLAADTRDRSIPIRLVRNEGTPELRWAEMPGVAERLKGRLAAWAERVSGDSGVRRPSMPDGIGGRDRDRWEPLIGAAAGTYRDDWKALAVELCKADREAREAEREDAGLAYPQQLVLDMHGVLTDGDQWTTSDVVARLISAHPERYGYKSGKELTARALGGVLGKHWGIRSSQLRFEGGKQLRGFQRDSLERAWAQAGAAS